MFLATQPKKLFSIQTRTLISLTVTGKGFTMRSDTKWLARLFSLIQAPGVFKVKIDQSTTAPTGSPALLSLALVDRFGASVSTPFLIHFIEPTDLACSDIVLNPPVVTDHTYILGDTEKHIHYEI
jgi:hypothetical protein